MHQHVRIDDPNEQYWQLWDWKNESNRLADEIADMEKTGMHPHSSMSYSLWDIFTEYGVMPNAGGYLDQPDWFDKDVRYFNKKQHLISLGVMIDHHEQQIADQKNDYHDMEYGDDQ